MNGQEFPIRPIIDLLAEDRNAKLRGINASLGQVTRMITIETTVRKLTGKIRGKNRVSSTTLQSRPIVSGVWEMEMEERNSGEPETQPYQNGKAPFKDYLNYMVERSRTCSGRIT